MTKEKQELSAQAYKDRCDEVLLKRGKKSGKIVPQGISTEQVLDFLEEDKEKDYKIYPKFKALNYGSQIEYSGWLSFNGLESSTYSSSDYEDFEIYGDFQDKKTKKKSKTTDKEIEDLYNLDIEETIKEFGKL